MNREVPPPPLPHFPFPPCDSYLIPLFFRNVCMSSFEYTTGNIERINFFHKTSKKENISEYVESASLKACQTTVLHNDRNISCSSDDTTKNLKISKDACHYPSLSEALIENIKNITEASAPSGKFKCFINA